jgi:hypothetical protein
MIELSVAGLSSELTFPPIPKLVPLEYAAYLSTEEISTGAGGLSDPGLHTQDTCVEAPSGWKFAPGSAVTQNRDTTDETGSWITTADEHRICWHVEASSSAKGKHTQIYAKVSALKYRPEPAVAAAPAAAPVTVKGKNKKKS